MKSPFKDNYLNYVKRTNITEQIGIPHSTKLYKRNIFIKKKKKQ